MAQFPDQLQKPDVDFIEGLSPSIAIRGRELVVYLSCEGEKQHSLLRQVGRHKMGKCCLYFKRLADLAPSVLEKLVVGSIAETRRRYG